MAFKMLNPVALAGANRAQNCFSPSRALNSSEDNRRARRRQAANRHLGALAFGETRQ
jgi:hypothetical protein